MHNMFTTSHTHTHTHAHTHTHTQPSHPEHRITHKCSQEQWASYLTTFRVDVPTPALRKAPVENLSKGKNHFVGAKTILSKLLIVIQNHTTNSSSLPGCKMSAEYLSRPNPV